jgi:hypothetical protein
VLAALSLVTLIACAAAPIDGDLGSAGTSQTKKKPASSDPPPPPPSLDSADASTPDAAPECETASPNNKCGLDPQCGCGTNETCTVSSETTGAVSCVSAGTQTLGRPCAQTGDCVAGLACFYGACRPYCSSARSKCSAPGTDLCVEVLDAQNQPEPNMLLCTIACDPRVPSTVCGTNACLWFPTYYSPEKVSDCNFAGATPAYSTCQSDADCKPGYACVDHPKYGPECERWCRVGVAGDCNAPSGETFPPDLSCKDVFGANAPVINGQTEGVCQDD